jgi:hypothetical protein
MPGPQSSRMHAGAGGNGVLSKTRRDVLKWLLQILKHTKCRVWRILLLLSQSGIKSNRPGAELG